MLEGGVEVGVGEPEPRVEQARWERALAFEDDRLAALAEEHLDREGGDRKDGRAVDAWALIPVSFRLDEKSAPVPRSDGFDVISVMPEPPRVD